MRLARALAGLSRGVAAWWRSPPGERALFAEAWCRLLVHDLAFRWRRDGRQLRRSSGRRPGQGPAPDTERLLAVFERAAHNRPGRAACLPRSLALRGFLGRHGVVATVRIGLRRSGAGIEGHAWVERDGEPASREQPAAFVSLHVRSEEGAP